MPIQDITLLGAGNVGAQLGKAFLEAGFRIKQVFSRRLEKAEQVAQDLGSTSANTLDRIQPGADVYVLAVSDDAIQDVARSLGRQLGTDALVVHTSGATPSVVLAGIFPRHGIFYPLQSLNATRQAAFGEIPICIHAARKPDEDLLDELARALSRRVYRLDDRDRAQLHVAAVFANNFTNQLFHIAAEILSRRDLPFALLRPLIRETAAKVQEAMPADMQTGPACRGDIATLENHLKILEAFPQYREIYLQLTRSINPDLDPALTGSR